MRKFFNPTKESILPLLSAVLDLLPPYSRVPVETSTYPLSASGMRSAFPLAWWSVWLQCHMRRCTPYKRDASADDPIQKFLTRLLRELLDDHAYLPHNSTWIKPQGSLERVRINFLSGASKLLTPVGNQVLARPTPEEKKVQIVNTTDTNILPFLCAEASEDLNESFNKIEREVDLENQLAALREEYTRTRAALQEQTQATKRIGHERQVERTLNTLPSINPKAIPAITELLMRGDAGELEEDKHGRLREKFGTRSIEEVAADYLRANPHFLSGSADSAQVPKLDRAKMTPKEKGRYIAEHGQDAYFALPLSDPRLNKLK